MAGGGRTSAVLAVACAALLGAVPATAEPAGSTASVPRAPAPPATSSAEASAYAESHPDAAPPGSNDFSCIPSAQHPRPVVLAHGTDSNSYTDFAALAPLLEDSGWCVYALNFGKAPGADDYGTGDIRVSARQFGDFVDTVRAETGAGTVDVVGFSQGATVSRYYINRLGGAPAVDRWIGVASPSYGGTFYGLGPIAGQIPGASDIVADEFSVALVQQAQGSELLTELNNPTDTVPGVEYTTIGTRVDEVIQPPSNVALHGPGAVNLVIQDLCPDNLTGHFNMPYDNFSLALIRQTLDPDTYGLGPCVPVALGTGIPEVILESNF
ncbi:esterase/lipase family protein [Rhodococcus zopfii]|uniref:esterase/lipase family protein n=2 Tax=Rhodococcus zopfii TaxID=43772 RepID=UPI0009332001|nr:alpha/beta fold hydrolase [Rhodococcus zopfii]